VQLVVEQTLIKDADVFAGQLCEVDGRSDDPRCRPFANALRGARQQHEHPVHRLIVRGLRRRLEQRQGSLDRVAAGITRAKEIATIGGDDKLRVQRALMQQTKERKEPRPG
jgi:hypothetical protein